MINLVINDFNVHSALEQALCEANIEFQYKLDIESYGLKSPYLIVDGVPLDETRAYKWIKEHKNG